MQVRLSQCDTMTRGYFTANGGDVFFFFLRPGYPIGHANLPIRDGALMWILSHWNMARDRSHVDMTPTHKRREHVANLMATVLLSGDVGKLLTPQECLR